MSRLYVKEKIVEEEIHAVDTCIEGIETKLKCGINNKERSRNFFFFLFELS